VSDLSAYFGLDGPLAQRIPGFRLRSQQVEMAQAVAQAIEQQEMLIVEAGTGTGKTFAYLVPALLAGGKVIISTGTKTLQDQLFTRDLPAVREALRAPVTVALLKGRANFVCHYHLERAAIEGRFKSREEVQQLKSVERYAATSQAATAWDSPACRRTRRSGRRSLPRARIAWARLPALQAVLRDEGAQTGARGGCGGSQSSPILCRRHAAR
jgi:Rad3-related DNA helicase